MTHHPHATPRTLSAALLAAAVVGAGVCAGAAPAFAASDPIPAGQRPYKIDVPGKTHDMVRLYTVPGISWEMSAADAADMVPVEGLTPWAKYSTVPVAQFGPKVKVAAVRRTPATDTAPATRTVVSTYTLSYDQSIADVRISDAQQPAAVDNPGTGADYVRLTKIPGITWAVDGVEQDLGSATKLVKVDQAQVDVTYRTDSDDYRVVSPVQSWTLDFPKGRVTNVVPTPPVFLDRPGTASDAVRLTGGPGLVWEVNGTAVKTPNGTVNVPLKNYAQPGVSWAAEVAVRVADDDVDLADGQITEWNKDYTAGDIELGRADLTSHYGIEDNPGGRSRDRVWITPVEGVSWQVCDSAPFAVTQPTVRPATCRTAQVSVKAVPSAGYRLGFAPGELPALDLTDAPGATSVLNRGSATVPTADASLPSSVDIGVRDLAGNSKDALVPRPVENLVWYVGRTPAGAADDPTKARWSKVAVPRSGNAVVAVGGGRGQNRAWLKAEPVNDDYVLSSDFQAFAVNFDSDPAQVDTDAAVTRTSDGLTIADVDGITGWTLTDPTNPKSRPTSLKVTPYAQITLRPELRDAPLTPIFDRDHVAAPKTS